MTSWKPMLQPSPKKPRPRAALNTLHQREGEHQRPTHNQICEDWPGLPSVIISGMEGSSWDVLRFLLQKQFIPRLFGLDFFGTCLKDHVFLMEMLPGSHFYVPFALATLVSHSFQGKGAVHRESCSFNELYHTVSIIEWICTKKSDQWRWMTLKIATPMSRHVFQINSVNRPFADDSWIRTIIRAPEIHPDKKQNTKRTP